MWGWGCALIPRPHPHLLQCASRTPHICSTTYHSYRAAAISTNAGRGAGRGLGAWPHVHQGGLGGQLAGGTYASRLPFPLSYNIADLDLDLEISFFHLSISKIPYDPIGDRQNHLFGRNAKAV